MRATPPSRRMSEGTRSSAITATAPASSAMRACSARGDVHDHAALEHLGQARLERRRVSRLLSRPCGSLPSRRVRSLQRAAPAQHLVHEEVEVLAAGAVVGDGRRAARSGRRARCARARRRRSRAGRTSSALVERVERRRASRRPRVAEADDVRAARARAAPARRAPRRARPGTRPAPRSAGSARPSLSAPSRLAAPIQTLRARKPRESCGPWSAKPLARGRPGRRSTRRR